MNSKIVVCMRLSGKDLYGKDLEDGGGAGGGGGGGGGAGAAVGGTLGALALVGAVAALALKRRKEGASSAWSRMTTRQPASSSAENLAARSDITAVTATADDKHDEVIQMQVI